MGCRTYSVCLDQNEFHHKLSWMFLLNYFCCEDFLLILPEYNFLSGDQFSLKVDEPIVQILYGQYL